MPIARPYHAVTAPDRTVTIPVLANDTATGPDPLAVVELGQPASGDVAVTGARSPTPRKPASSGTDRFIYAAGDGAGMAVAEVTVEVRPANGPPRPAPDSILTLAGQPVLIEPLANDADHDHDRLRLLGFSLPEHGTLALQAQQRLLYTPEPDFAGEDGFRYRLTDAAGNEAEGEVRIAVLAVNAPPVAVPDLVTVEAGMSLTIDPVANDLDPDGDPLRLVSVTLPQHGRLAVMADRRLVYTANDGHLGSDGFSYTVRDRQGALATGSVAITVTAPASPTAYLNGYRYRCRLVVPAASVTGRHEGFPLLVRERGAWLKSRAQGGRVESEAGLDLRFELTDGTRLDHELAHTTRPGELAAGSACPCCMPPPSRPRPLLRQARPYRGRGRPCGGRGRLSGRVASAGRHRSQRQRASSGRQRCRGDGVGAPGPGRPALRERRVPPPRRRLARRPHRPHLSPGHRVRHRPRPGPLHRGPDRRAGQRRRPRRALCRPGQRGEQSSGLHPGASGRPQPARECRREPDHRTPGGECRLGARRRPVLALDGPVSAPAPPRPCPAWAVSSSPRGRSPSGRPADTAAGGWRGQLDETRLRAAALSAGWLRTEHAESRRPAGLLRARRRAGVRTALQVPLARPVRASTVAPGGSWRSTFWPPPALLWGPPSPLSPPR